MGRRTTKELRKPKRLGAKLAAIRRYLQLSQGELISRLGFRDELVREEISAFERGVRVPPLVVLLGYARTVSITVEALIDDDLNLPAYVAAESLRGSLPDKTVEGISKGGSRRSIGRSSKRKGVK